jgi:hypothetical protein
MDYREMHCNAAHDDQQQDQYTFQRIACVPESRTRPSCDRAVHFRWSDGYTRRIPGDSVCVGAEHVPARSLTQCMGDEATAAVTRSNRANTSNGRR